MSVIVFLWKEIWINMFKIFDVSDYFKGKTCQRIFIIRCFTTRSLTTANLRVSWWNFLTRLWDWEQILHSIDSILHNYVEMLHSIDRILYNYIQMLQKHTYMHIITVKTVINKAAINQFIISLWFTSLFRPLDLFLRTIFTITILLTRVKEC